MDQPFEINIVHPGLRQFVNDDFNDDDCQSRMDDDLFDSPLNVEFLNIFKFYSTLKPEHIYLNLQDSEQVAKNVIDVLINDCSVILYDKYIDCKLDDHVLGRLDEYADFAQMQQYIDFEKSGYEEFLDPDEEPVFLIPFQLYLKGTTNKDSWNRNQVETEAENAGQLQKTMKNWGMESKLNASFYSTLSDGRSNRPFGITQSTLYKEFKGEKDKEKDKHKDKNEPKAVPLKNIRKEIDIVEEQKRSFKERELKQKQEKQDQENLRQIEAKEQQYKLNRLNNDVKSKNITFDYDGNIIILQHVKVDRLPPTNYIMNYGVQETRTEPPKNILMVKAQQQMQKDAQQLANLNQLPDQKTNTVPTQPSQRQTQSQSLPPKKKREDQQAMAAPPVFETFAPGVGVTFTEGSKIKSGPRQGIPQLSSKNMAILLSDNSQSIRLSKIDYMNLIRGGNLSRTTQEEKTPQESSIAKQKELASIDESLREGDSRRKNDKSLLNQDASVIKITNPKFLDELIQSAMEPDPKDEQSQQRRVSCDQVRKFKDGDDIAPNIFDQFNMSILKQKGEWGKNATGQKFLPSLARARKPDISQISKEFQQNLYKLPRERFPRSLLMNSQSFKKLPGGNLAPLKENKSVIGQNFRKLPV